jgi:hypothetical protein
MHVHLTCETCGAAVLRTPGHVKPHTYCSRRCQPGNRRPPSHIPTIRDDGVALLPLCARDGSIRAHALLDADDVSWANQWRWSFGSGGYAYRTEGRRTILLHRELLGLVPGDGLEVDHRNLDKLDDRRANLRIVPHGGNAQNVPSQGGSSRYRGVFWSTTERRWLARVTVNGKLFHLGTFTDEPAEVARAARQRLMPYSTG